MADSVRIANYQRPVELLDIAERGKQSSKADKPSGDTFKEMFSRELAEDRSVMFSKHASQRLFSRNIELSTESLNKIADAIDKAAEKGSKETLILTDDAALVVSIKDRTVVTAFDRDHLREGVVTSIDSAVIL
jgi:flagellar operon protein